MIPKKLLDKGSLHNRDNMAIKYSLLTKYLKEVKENDITFTYDELEDIFGDQLPKTLTNEGITRKSSIGKAILKGGFSIKSNSYNNKKIELSRDTNAQKILNNLQLAKEKKHTIFLNKVFPEGADYLRANIGHEIINIFGGDNNEYHYYLNPYGLVNEKEIPDYILSICKVSPKVYKVLNMAVIDCPEEDSIAQKNKAQGLYEKQQKRYKYNGIFLEQYFDSNSSGNTVLASFKCKGIYEPIKPLFITFNYPQSSVKENCINLVSIGDGRTTVFKKFNQDDQNKLEEIVTTPGLWQKKPIKSFKDYVAQYKNIRNGGFSYFKELGIEDQELQYSNAIKLFLYDKERIYAFLKHIGCNISKKDNFIIAREHYNIDLLFTNFNLKDPSGKDEEKIIIIENKIKANITPSDKDKTINEQIEKVYCDIFQRNSSDFSENDKAQIQKISEFLGVTNSNVPSQLSKYYIYSVILAKNRDWDDEQIKNNIQCFFLCPEYSRMQYEVNENGYLQNNTFTGKSEKLFLQEKYKLITYKKIYNIFKGFIKPGSKTKSNIFLEDFVEALANQAKERDDSLERKMIELFYQRSK